MNRRPPGSRGSDRPARRIRSRSGPVPGGGPFLSPSIGSRPSETGERSIGSSSGPLGAPPPAAEQGMERGRTPLAARFPRMSFTADCPAQQYVKLHIRATVLALVGFARAFAGLARAGHRLRALAVLPSSSTEAPSIWRESAHHGSDSGELRGDDRLLTTRQAPPALRRAPCAAGSGSWRTPGRPQDRVDPRAHLLGRHRRGPGSRDIRRGADLRRLRAETRVRPALPLRPGRRSDGAQVRPLRPQGTRRCCGRHSRPRWWSGPSSPSSTRATHYSGAN